MKNLLLTLLLLPALAAAKVPVEEDIVAKTSDPDSPFYYTSLMMRYNAGDETLTDEDSTGVVDRVLKALKEEKDVTLR